LFWSILLRVQAKCHNQAKVSKAFAQYLAVKRFMGVFGQYDRYDD